MKLVFVLLAITFFFKADLALAQAGLIQGANDPSKADLKVLTNEGRLTHVIVNPEEKSAEFYLVGKKEGELKFNTKDRFNGQILPGVGDVSSSRGAVAHKPHVVQKPKKHLIASVPKKVQVLLHPLKQAHNPVPVVSKPILVAANAPVKKASSSSDNLLLLFIFLALLLSLYAYATSLKTKRRNETARIF